MLMILLSTNIIHTVLLERIIIPTLLFNVLSFLPYFLSYYHSYPTFYRIIIPTLFFKMTHLGPPRRVPIR
jgi:hypothetical protein